MLKRFLPPEKGTKISRVNKKFYGISKTDTLP
jgi:hypothetical protein